MQMQSRLLSILLLSALGTGCLEEPLSSKNACRGDHDCDALQECIRSICAIPGDSKLGNEDPGDTGDDEPDVLEDFEITGEQIPTNDANDVLFEILVNKLDTPISLARIDVMIKPPGKSYVVMNVAFSEDADADNLVSDGDRLQVIEPGLNQIGDEVLGQELEVVLSTDREDGELKRIATLYWFVGDKK